MINHLLVTLIDKVKNVSDHIQLKLYQDLSITEDYKLQLIKNIISSLTSSAIDVELKVEYNSTREFSFEDLAARIKNLNKSKQQAHGTESLLSNREKEVLSFILKGYTNREIARMLFISFETVKSHRKNILSKTGSRNTASLAKFFSASAL